MDRLWLFLDSMGGGAWPLAVGEAICLVHSDNERDLNIFTSFFSILSQERIGKTS
jgi:hypothetical protein